MTNSLPRDERIEVLSSEDRYRGFFAIEGYQLRHRRHDGGWTPPLRREVFCREPTAAVLPYDPERDEVVLIEQYRIGAHRAGLEPWLLEPVAGILEPGEEVDSLVRREAMEEAACRITDLAEIGQFLLSPGGSSEATILFIGRCSTIGLGGVHGLAEEGEDIKVHVMALSQAMSLLGSGHIAAVYAATCLQWLMINRPRLQALWL